MAVQGGQETRADRDRILVGQYHPGSGRAHRACTQRAPACRRATAPALAWSATTQRPLLSPKNATLQGASWEQGVGRFRAQAGYYENQGAGLCGAVLAHLSLGRTPWAASPAGKLQISAASPPNVSAVLGLLCRSSMAGRSPQRSAAAAKTSGRLLAAATASTGVPASCGAAGPGPTAAGRCGGVRPAAARCCTTARPPSAGAGRLLVQAAAWACAPPCTSEGERGRQRRLQLLRTLGLACEGQPVAI